MPISHTSYKRIDRETVQRILDTADIVEVVSDFVSLKKRGANYIGLCPFHNERTPSFSVSKTKGICKCFSCGKGGSAVNFIMELEQMTFNEALRYLAKKYNIEIKEHDLTPEEQQRITERESLLAVNDFALKHFTANLTQTDDGRDIGLAYFRERGINDSMIERFKLGYALDKSDALYKDALKAGYEAKHLINTGLCSQSDRGVYDRFRGRVIYPVFSVSGRVIAFGGRTLRNDKKMAKYVNSPESDIYHKSNELYGLYQAKQAIGKADKCILVEGYMDVISMHQAGIENVVASSGTSLTEGQIRLIHRFTENVTVIYDSDPAGIKASLRGIDLLLAEGMNIKVLQLPEGDDPDSYAQNHSATEVEEYIKTHETDFMRFKTDILLRDAGDDPIARARVINDIIRSISVIPDGVVRSVYIRECSRMLSVAENVLQLQLDKLMADNAEKAQTKPRQFVDSGSEKVGGETPDANDGISQNPTNTTPANQHTVAPIHQTTLYKYEAPLMKYIVKYGYSTLGVDEEGIPFTTLEYVQSELSSDGIVITDPALAKVFDETVSIFMEEWGTDREKHYVQIEEERQAMLASGREEIRTKATDLGDIQAREAILTETCDNVCAEKKEEYARNYLLNRLMSHPDDIVRKTSTALANEKHVLSKYHTRYAKVETEAERLSELVPRAVLELKLGILNEEISSLIEEMKHCPAERLMELLERQKELYEIRAQFAKLLGERIVVPVLR